MISQESRNAGNNLEAMKPGTLKAMTSMSTITSMKWRRSKNAKRFFQLFAISAFQLFAAHFAAAKDVLEDQKMTTATHLTINSGAFENFVTGSKIQIDGTNIGANQILYSDASQNIAKATITTNGLALLSSTGDLTIPGGANADSDNLIFISTGGAGSPLSSFLETNIISDGASGYYNQLGWVPVTNQPFLGNAVVLFDNWNANPKTSYGPLFGAAGGNQQIHSGSPGTAGQILTSNGSSAYPTFQSLASTFGLSLMSAANGVAALSLVGGQAHSTYLDTFVSASGHVDWVSIDNAPAFLVDVPVANVAYVSKAGFNSGANAGSVGHVNKPFLTITAAKAAVTSGQVIVVTDGIYNENDLAKNGVNYYFYPGAGITYTGTSTFGIFDDYAGAVSMKIGGEGIFTLSGTGSYGGSSIGTITINNSGSDVNAIGRVFMTTVSGASPGSGAIVANNGKVRVHAFTVSNTATGGSSAAIWWNQGECHIEADNITAGRYVAYTNALAQSTPNQALWITAHYIQGQFFQLQGDATAQIWINAQEIDLSSNTGQAVGVALAGPKIYLEAEKVICASASPFYNRYSVGAIGGMNAWLHVMKLTQNGAGVGLVVSGASVVATIDEFQDGGTMEAAFACVAGGTHDLTFSKITTASGNTTAYGIYHSGGGTVRVHQGTIDATNATSGNPINVLSNGLSLGNVTLTASGSRDSITAGSAFTVQRAGTIMANNAASTNITFSNLLDLGNPAALKAANLGDIADAGASRANLAIETMAAVQAVATSNITLSGAQTIDSYSAIAGDRILCPAQTTASQRGVWIVASGGWTRPTDFASGAIVKTRSVNVNSGTVYANSQWVLTGSGNITVDTTSQTWGIIASSAKAYDNSAAPKLSADFQGRKLVGSDGNGSNGPISWGTGVLEVAGTDGNSSVTFDVSNGNNDDNSISLQGVNGNLIGFRANGRGAIQLGDDNTTTHQITIDLASITAARTQHWQDRDGTIALLQGTATNDSAAAGSVGENPHSEIVAGSAVSLTTATAANVTSISLTAGDWDVRGNVNFAGASSTVTARSGGLTATSATVPTDGTEVFAGGQTTTTSETTSVSVPSKRFSLASTTTIYLVGKATFSAGTMGEFGSISARRVR